MQSLLCKKNRGGSPGALAWLWSCISWAVSGLKNNDDWPVLGHHRICSWGITVIALHGIWWNKDQVMCVPQRLKTIHATENLTLFVSMQIGSLYLNKTWCCLNFSKTVIMRPILVYHFNDGKSLEIVRSHVHCTCRNSWSGFELWDMNAELIQFDCDWFMW